MADLLLERFTYCPTGNPADELAFEVVLQDNDGRPITDPTPRVTTLARLFTRGDLAPLRTRQRELILTTGRGALRTVVRAGRVTSDHVDINLSALGLTLTLPLVRGLPLSVDYYGGPVRGTAPPDDGSRFDDYKAREPRR
jgi:hypothetical protein